MALTLYNTLTRRQETFASLEPDKVQMYYCGVTVYDYCHLGHARACIIWDVTRRYLEWRGYKVNFVQNFTDIDDKILNRAREEGSSMEEVADRYIQAYFEDMDRLNIQRASEYPRATHTINGIKRLIHELEQKSYAYAAEGDVYYAVRKFPEYGKLSGRNLEDMQAGASGRVEAEEPEGAKKRDPFDFALWKGAKPGEPSWESDWGEGRPGWHIECSAMVRDRLGETIDIHAGGADLIFPHHENEIAQSEAVTGKPLARYWLHNGMVTVNGEKMSKSLGNFITIRDLLDRPTDPMAVRLFVLTAQYRKPIDFTDEAIQAATNGWNTLKEGLLFGHQYGAQLGWTKTTAESPDSEVLESELSASPTISTFTSSAESQSSASSTEATQSLWQQTLAQILQPFSKSPQLLREFITEYKALVAISILILLSGLPLRILVAFLRAINDIPLLAPTFELIGIWVTAKSLLRPNVQQAIQEKARSLKAVIFSKNPQPKASEALIPAYIQRFQAAVDDDLNFSAGLAVLFELAKDIRRERNILVHTGKLEAASELLKRKWLTLIHLAQVLGLEANLDEDLGANATGENTVTAEGLTGKEIEALIQQRNEARKAKNFAEGDRIRNELQAKGITLIDQPGGGTTWHLS